MECKFEIDFWSLDGYTCINRNIVECKWVTVCALTRQTASINRNIVECKSRKGWTFQQLLSVLIETLWNVNWISVLLSLNTGSINRNIVECKSLTPTHQYQPCSGINRNIVECKFNYWWSYYHSTFVLIETLWNVNFRNRFNR